MSKNRVSTRNPYMKIYRGSPVKGMHRPEGAVNCDNMDAVNFVDETNTIRVRATEFISGGRIMSDTSISGGNVTSGDEPGHTHTTLIGSDHPHQDVKTTATPVFDGLTSTDQINLSVDGHNIITASRVAGELRLGAGGMTADLIIDTGGNVIIGENLTVNGTIINTDFTTLTDNSIANALHRHSELVASDGSPDPAFSVDASGNMTTNGDINMATNDISFNANQGIILRTFDGTSRERKIEGSSGVDRIDWNTPILRFSAAGFTLQTTASASINLFNFNATSNLTIENTGGSGVANLIVENNITAGGDLIVTGRSIGSTDDTDLIEMTPNLVAVQGEVQANAKSKMTLIGGYAIKLENRTDEATVAGQLVKVFTTTAINDAFDTQDANGDNTIGVVLDAGVGGDGEEAWVVVAGIADVLIDAGGCARGDRMISSATAGSADVWNVGGAVATHFLEIGHCIETRTGAGLARCVLHFN